jgi:hypothetical protein
MCNSREALPAGSRPRWSRLFVILPLATGALALIELGVAALPLRGAAEAGVVLATFGAMAWWVRANRTALSQLERCACGSTSITVRVIRSQAGQPREQGAPEPLSLAAGSAPPHARPAGARLGE